MDNKGRKPSKLGNSTNITIGNKTYSSYDAPKLKPQTKEVHRVNSWENAPRDIAQKSVDNQANTVKTSNSTSTQTLSIKTTAKSPSTPKTGGSSGDYSARTMYSSESTVNKSTSIITGTTINAVKSKVQTSTVQTGGEQKQRLQSNIQRQTAIMVTPQSIIRNKPVVLGGQRLTSIKARVLTKAKNKLQSTLESQNDSGTSTLSTSITAGVVSIKTFKAAQIATPHVVKAAQGTYNVGVKTINVVRTVDSTIGKIQNGAIKLNHQTMLQFKTMATQKLMSTEPMQRLSHAVVGVRTAVNTTRRYGIMVGQGAIKAVTVTRGVLTGTVTIQISKQRLQSFRNATFKGIKLTGHMAGIAVKTGTVNAFKTGLRSIRHGSKGMVTGVVGIGDMLAKTEDMGAQAMGLGIKSAYYSGKAIKTSPKVLKCGTQSIKTAIFAPINTGKTIYRTGKGVVGMAKMVSKFGIKDTVRYYRAKALKVVAKTGGSAISAMVQSFKFLGMKVVAPIILLVVLVVGISNMATAPVSGIAAIFGGAFTNKDSGTDYEVHTYLEGAVEPKKNELVAKIRNIRDTSLVSNGGSYHYARLFTATDTNEIDLTEGNIKNAIYTSTELVTLIEPVFQTILLTKYNLEPTQAQIDSTLDDIWNTLIKVTTKELPMEYCYDDPCSECGHYHASISTCPNIIEGTHGSYTCSSCCYIQSHNSSGTNPDGSTWTNTWYTDECNGYHYCGGHRILAITIDLDGYYELLAKYFTDPIDQLANLSNRTAEQEDELQTLKDNYELCLSYMEVVLENYGSGLGGSDISGVNFINGTRSNNDALIGVAEMQLGNIGGMPFWSWYGFNGRVEWCACFVSWCENQLGNIANGIVPKFCSCREGTKWYKEHGQWAAGGYQEPVAGDIIFFDWEGDGDPNHVGIVVGNDGERVYTIEGNSGDVCRRRSYPLNSSVILGYGLPNY